MFVVKPTESNAAKIENLILRPLKRSAPMETRFFHAVKSEARTRAHFQGPPVGRTRPGASLRETERGS